MTNTEDYQFLPALFLRAPHYSFSGYDLVRLPEVLRQRDFLNAVWLASPEFYRTLESCDFDECRLDERQRHTLRKYYNRICFRPTPFGSFASFTLLQWGDGDPVRLCGFEDAFLHLLPDQQLLYALHQDRWAASSHKELTVNPALYRVNDAYRYVKSSADDRGRYVFTLEVIEAVDFLDKLFLKIQEGAAEVKGILDWMGEEARCSVSEARDYLSFLLEEQVLLTPEQGSLIRQVPAGVAGLKDRYWKKFWRAYATQPLHTRPVLPVLWARLSARLPGSGQAVTQPFYAALEKTLEKGGPAMADQAQLRQALQVLRLLHTGQQQVDLSAFTRDFRQRFDQAKVPLLEALDPDTGISYGRLHVPAGGAEQLHDLSFPEPESPARPLDWSPVHQLLFRIWTGNQGRDPWAPIQMEKEDVEVLKQSAGPLPAWPQTQAVMYRNTGEYLLIEQAAGVTATSLIGRFSCFSSPVHELCRELARMEAEANPGVIFADISVLSDTHVDNINRRKPVYDYEIPVNVFPDTPPDRQIRPDDLWLSIDKDELILESRRLGKRIIPRLPTAYNFHHNHLPLFRLLGDLQYQGAGSFYFDLETCFPGLTFYPRISVGQVVISAARWKFSTADLRSLQGDGGGGFQDRLKAFRSRYRLPRHVSLGNGDQQLVFDLASPAEVLFFRQCIRGMTDCTLWEYFYPDRSVLSGNKPLAGQFIAFMTHQEEMYPGLPPQGMATEGLQRRFMMGSEWLYIKIFCSPRLVDELLIGVIAPLIDSEQKDILKWFFIRYTENGHHLRLRIQGGEQQLGRLLSSLKNRLTEGGYDRLIKSYQSDVYEREIERYGAKLLPHVEELFYRGSELWLSYLDECMRGSRNRDDFSFGLLTAKNMITSFWGEDEASLEYIKVITAGFLHEFKADKALKTQMNDRFRVKRGGMYDRGVSDESSAWMERLLAQLAYLRQLTADEPRDISYSLLSDVVHMQLNRIFMTEPRQQELLVYYWLEKDLLSTIARKKTKSL